MLSAIFLLSGKGKVLVNRFYRDDVGRAVAEAFRLHVVNAKQVRSPVITVGTTTFLHIKHGNIYIVAVTRQNVHAAMVFEYLHAMVTIFKGYFGGVFDEDTVQNNFVTIYELLDEVLDYGYPQTTTVDILKMYILSGNKKLFNFGASSDKVDGSQIAAQVTGAVSWRKPNLKYRKNELFIDAIESINLLMSAKGTVLRADVAGKIVIKAFLSGMPECKLGVNDKVVMDKETRNNQVQRGGGYKRAITIDDCTFHQCVKLGKWDSDRSVSFIPPDGEFELMSYRITDNVNLPFRVLPLMKELGRTRLEAKVTVKANFSAKLFASNVIIKIPVPKNTAECRIAVAMGKAKYSSADSAMIWKIRRFQGDTEFNFSAEIELMASVSEKKAWSRPPISMEFQVPMFTASGLHVRFFKVFEKSGYTPIRWVRYITKAGVYENRI